MALVASSDGSLQPHDLDPRLLARLEADTPARQWLLRTLTAASDQPERATSTLRRAMREARSLRSRERRALWDVLYALIRAEDALGCDTWDRSLDRWLTTPDLSDLPFHRRAGCTPEIAHSLHSAYGEAREDWLHASNRRAPTYLRANLKRTSPPALVTALSAHDIRAEVVGATAVRVLQRANLVGLRAFRRGWFELQDAASQQICLHLRPTGKRVLDFCAGAGGKSLALAALGAQVTAHDVRSAPLDELRRRAKRAGAKVRVTEAVTGQFEQVLVDAPCSGTGVWRRHPEFRWRIRDGVSALVEAQLSILQVARNHVAPRGELFYATCSVLPDENEAVVEAFLNRNPGWIRFQPDLRTAPHIQGWDGMFVASLHRA